MNHELVHVATMGQPAGPDKFLPVAVPRQGGHGQGAAGDAIYAYLTAPRVAAPRWFHEGIAVFADTWMAGGIGRAQGGWDEMVFRAMVKDNAHIYDPLGLASEGTKIDFQLQINSYLYGTRFMTWLADRYSPEKLVEWMSRKPGSKAYYASQFKKVFGRSIEDAWTEWIASRRPSSRRTSRRFGSTRSRRTRTCRRGRWVRSRAPTTTRRPGRSTRPSTTRASSRTWGRSTSRAGSVDAHRGRQGPGDVHGHRRSPGTRTAARCSTRRDNGAYRDLMSLDPATGRKKTAVEGRADRRPRVQPGGQGRSGASGT